jgi:hypothetical protein
MTAFRATTRVTDMISSCARCVNAFADQGIAAVCEPPENDLSG